MSDKHHFTLKIYQKPLHSYVLWPFAKIVQLLQRIYDSLVGLIWQEIATKEKQDFMATIVSFLLLSTFAICIYKLERYSDAIVIVLFALWFMDFFLSKLEYSTSNNYRLTSLEKKGDKFVCKTDVPNKKPQVLDFHANDIKYVAIYQKAIKSGAFLTKMTNVWVASIILKNKVDIIIAQEKEIAKVLREAKKLESSWDLKVKFLDSEGDSEYALFPKNIASKSSSIHRQRNQSKITISYKWSFVYFRSLVAQVLSKIGFLLFVCILSNCLVSYGKLAYSLVCPAFGIPKPFITVDFSLLGQLFIPKGEPKDFVELAFIIFLLMYNIKLTTSPKTICIDGATTFIESPGEKNYLNTTKMEFVLLIRKPEFCVLMSDGNKVAVIKNLQTPQDYYTLLNELEKTIAE